MNCIQVIDRDGKPSRVFAQLLGKHNGNEEKALEEFALNRLISDKVSFSLSSVIADTKGFVNSLFRVQDEFTKDNENSFRAQLDVKLVPKKDATTGVEMIYYRTAMGVLKSAPASEKAQIIDDLVEEKRSLRNETGIKLHKVLKSAASGKMKETAESEFGETSYNLIKSSMHGINPSEVRDYSEFSGEPWYVPSLANEKILIHVKTNSKGEKIYNFIMPTHSHGNKEFGSSGSTFIGAKILGSNTLSESHGITIQENIKGRKQFVASILASNILFSDPKASIESARFISFSGEGVFAHLDINHGTQVLWNIMRVDAFELSPDINALKSNPDAILSAGRSMDYVSFLFESYNSASDSGNNIDDFKKAYGNSNKREMLDAINRQMYFLMRTHNRTINGRKEYEHPESNVGKEMIMLARAKQQLMMIDGFDYRGKNTFNEMGWLESWVHTQGEYANVDMNMVFQEVQALEDGAKQRFKNRHVSQMKAAVNEFIKNNGGTSVKGKVLNDTQAYFENLFDKVKVRRLEPDGNYSEPVEVNILKFKDPDDTRNNLTPAERVFVRKMIALHKDSLVRLMDKKIKDGLNKDFASGIEWYEKKYKSQELLLPVTRKSSSEIFSSGEFKEGGSAWLEDFTNIYNLNDQSQSNKEYIFGKFGSASSQLGGEYGSESRLKSMGLEYVNDELVLIDPKKNNTLSVNVEQSLNLSAYNNEKAALEMELHTVYNAARINLLNDRIADRGKELETLKAMFENLVYGDMEKTKFTKNRDAMKAVHGARKITSLGTLTLNWKSALLATLGANMSLFSDSLSQRYGSHFFNAKDYGKATLWVGANPGKFDKLIDLFMFHESDEVNLLFSDKFQAAQKGIYKSRYNMILHSAGDRLVRGLLLVSQLIHDGIIDNFEEKNGGLVYNWSKDKRPDAVKKAIQENLAYRGVENLPYDEIMMRSLTTIAGKVMGSFTDADKARFQTNESAKVFAQFKAYLGARFTNLYSQGFENLNIRHYEVGKSGELTVENYYQEGVYQSVVHMLKEISRLGAGNTINIFEELKPEQQANLRKLLIDTSLFVGSFLVYQSLKAGLDDDKFMNSRYVEYAWLDLVGLYNPKDYLMAISSPVAIVYLGRLFTLAFNVITLDFDAATKGAISVFGPVRSVDDILRLFGEELK